MPRFRKRPVTIDAVQYTGDNTADVLDFVDGESSAVVSDGVLIIYTNHGPLAAEPGDWIIRGVQGEYYPCRAAVFAETYEAAK